MKGKTMQQSRTTRNSSGPLQDAQALNDLRLRVLKAKGGFLALGTESYMPFIDAQATREGISLDEDEKNALRQVMNGRLSLTDERRVKLIERALEQQQAA